eukprot:2136810-Prymnesium_polylepis.1
MDVEEVECGAARSGPERDTQLECNDTPARRRPTPRRRRLARSPAGSPARPSSRRLSPLLTPPLHAVSSRRRLSHARRLSERGVGNGV